MPNEGVIYIKVDGAKLNIRGSRVPEFRKNKRVKLGTKGVNKVILVWNLGQDPEKSAILPNG